MRLLLTIPLMLCYIISVAQKQAGQDYFPPAGKWEHRTPASMGLKQEAIDSAIARAIMAESPNPRNLYQDQARSFGREPFGNAIGPMAERGDPTGLIIYKGYIVGWWGQPDRVDMVHSVTKSFLSTVVGKAVDSGLIRNVLDTVAAYPMAFEVYNREAGTTSQVIRPFDTDHNRTITWDNLLRQTSDWEGTLWGKPEWADRPDSSRPDWKTRPRLQPGSVFEYNDVRVNALALAATGIWRRPLPQVFKEYIMDPIGASGSWRWTGYTNAWIVLDGSLMQSVSGGGHWGGGAFVNAWDLGRFGLLSLHRGRWNGRQLLSEQWIKQSLTPTPANTGYGYMNWFLNTDRKMLPAAPASAFMHLGNGNNLIFVDASHELVIVARWITSKGMNGVVSKVLEAGGWQ